MALITVNLRLVSPYGENDTAKPAAGQVRFTPVAHGKYQGALRTIETIISSIVQGEMAPVELTPGTWTVEVLPTKGNPWPPVTFTLEEGMEEPVNLADLAPEIVIKGEQLAKGDPGPQGPQGEPGPQGPAGPPETHTHPITDVDGLHDRLAGENASELISSRLAFRTGDVTVGIASDSTSDGSTDWVRLWEAHLAEKYPHLRIENRQWVNADGAYGPTTIVQEGTGEPEFTGDILHDTFTRTANLDTPDSGGPWLVQYPGREVLTGTGIYSKETAPASLAKDTGSKDHTTTLVIDLDSTGTGDIQRTELYHSAADGSRITLYTSAAGLTSIYGYTTPSGSTGTEQQFVQRLDQAVGVPVDAVAGLLTVTLESSIQVQTVTVEFDGKSWSESWTITEEAYSKKSGVATVHVGPVGHTLTEVTLSVEARPATRQVLRVLSGTMGGGTLQYQLDNWDAMFSRDVVDPGTPPTTEPATITDNFNRTGSLSGSQEASGETWAGNTAWSTDGSHAVCSGLNGASVTLDTPGAESATFNIEVVTAGATATEALRVGFRTIGNGVNGIYATVTVDTAGNIAVGSYVRTSGGGFRNIGGTTAHGITPGSEAAQTLPITLSLDGNTFTMEAGVDTVTGTITGAELAELGQKTELNCATPTLTSFRVDSVSAPYQKVVPGMPPVYGDPLDVMIIAHGHNYQRRSGDEYIPILEGFLDFMKVRRPSTLPLLCSQNPQFLPTANPSAHANRQAAVRSYARRNGYGYAPVFEHFAAQPDGGRAWVNSDGVHPTAPSAPTPTPGYGSSEWGKVLADVVTA